MILLEMGCAQMNLFFKLEMNDSIVGPYTCS